MIPIPRHSTKLFIPVLDTPETKDTDIILCGILEQLEPSVPSAGRRIALILPGILGHKDYLYLKRLALQIPIDSFRFDFRGNHESTGPHRILGFEPYVEDLFAVVDYLTTRYGYTIDVIVAHSRAVVDACRWMCTAEEAKNVRGFVNVSGRIRMPKVYESIVPDDRHLLATQGFYTVKAMVARKQLEVNISEADLIKFASIDTSLVWTHFPNQTHVLSMQGMQDVIVPPFDATVFARALGARHPGTHNLFYVEDADHNFTGMSDLVVDTILDWLQQLEHGHLRTGIWQTGVRGKL